MKNNNGRDNGRNNFLASFIRYNDLNSGLGPFSTCRRRRRRRLFSRHFVVGTTAPMGFRCSLRRFRYFPHSLAIALFDVLSIAARVGLDDVFRRGVRRRRRLILSPCLTRIPARNGATPGVAGRNAAALAIRPAFAAGSSGAGTLETLYRPSSALRRGGAFFRRLHLIEGKKIKLAEKKSGETN